MRLKRQTVEVHTGSVLLCDPFVLRHDLSQSLADGACFDLWVADGEFHVYTDGDSYFVDVDPRILRAKSRPQLTKLPDPVRTTTARLGIYDLTPQRMAAAAQHIAAGGAAVIGNLEPGAYVAWFEEKGAVRELFRGVVGFGRRITMLLNGDAGQQLQEIEDRIAYALRMKGVAKQIELDEIRDALCRLHLSGCNDRRLRMLAGANKFNLPRKSRRK